MVKLDIFDTVSLQVYERLRHTQYLNTDVFLVCFSMIDTDSFYNAYKKWLP